MIQFSQFSLNFYILNIKILKLQTIRSRTVPHHHSHIYSQIKLKSKTKSSATQNRRRQPKPKKRENNKKKILIDIVTNLKEFFCWWWEKHMRKQIDKDLGIDDDDGFCWTKTPSWKLIQEEKKKLNLIWNFFCYCFFYFRFLLNLLNHICEDSHLHFYIIFYSLLAYWIRLELWTFFSVWQK